MDRQDSLLRPGGTDTWEASRAVLPDLGLGRWRVGGGAGDEGGGVRTDVTKLVVSPASPRATQTKTKSPSWTSSGA